MRVRKVKQIIAALEMISMFDVDSGRPKEDVVLRIWILEKLGVCLLCEEVVDEDVVDEVYEGDVERAWLKLEYIFLYVDFW